MNVVWSGQLQLGSVYGASEPLTCPPDTRTKLIEIAWVLGAAFCPVGA